MSKIREKVRQQLAKSWTGARLDGGFFNELGIALPSELKPKIETALRLAPMLATASNIRGNPRLIKRFLIALSIRMAIARSHNVTVDEAVLTKLLLFERCGNNNAYDELMTMVATHHGGDN